MILVLLEHELITISGEIEKSKKRKQFSDLGLKVFLTIVAAAEVFLILCIFTIMLQLKSLDPEIPQKEEMVITEHRFSKEAISRFPKVKKKKKGGAGRKNKKTLGLLCIRNVMQYFE